MQVFLLRSSSIATDAPDVPEAQRHLSYDGRQLVRALGNALRLADEPSFDRVLTSPHPAALQTAELFAERTDYVGVIEVVPRLAGLTPAEVLVPQLITRGEKIVVVADEPLLATLGAFLIGRPTFPPSLHGQLSLIEDRKPVWFWRPGEMKRALLVA